MGSEAKRLLEQALHLSDVERAKLAASLIESLDPGADAAVEAEWAAEVARRADELDSGSTAAIPWDDARRRILADR
jgi:putative addiction module component (TIGR02574 family)